MKKNYSLYSLLLSKWVSTFGGLLQSTALPLVIFAITGSSALLSWTFFAETLPWLILAPFITNMLVMRFSSKALYMMCNLAKGICTIMLAIWIQKPLLVVGLFLILGIFNAVSASVYSALLRDNTETDNLNKILGLSLGIDDVVSIGAPICVTFTIERGFNGLIFLYVNATLLILSALLGLNIHAKKMEPRVKKVDLKELLDETIYNYKFLKGSGIGYLMISECFRSLVEGMTIPLLVIYATNITGNGEKVFTVGNTIMAISQVIMSFIYIYIKKFVKNNFIINLGAIAISSGLLILFFYPKIYIYCVSMILLGSGMAIRQLISENILIAKYRGEKLSKIVSVYNSVVSLAYLVGYILSAFQPYIASVKVYFCLGGVLLVFPFGISVKQKCTHKHNEHTYY